MSRSGSACNHLVAILLISALFIYSVDTLCKVKHLCDALTQSCISSRRVAIDAAILPRAHGEIIISIDRGLRPREISFYIRYLKNQFL